MDFIKEASELAQKYKDLEDSDIGLQGVGTRGYPPRPCVQIRSQLFKELFPTHDGVVDGENMEYHTYTKEVNGVLFRCLFLAEDGGLYD